MIVVSDASPLNYLVLIGSADVLPRLFTDVYTPPAVMRELLDSRAPQAVRQWAESAPAWLKVRSPTAPLAAAAGLGPGEAHAIALAKELGAAWLLIDERDGTKFAIQQGLAVIGTLAVLEEAASRKLLELPEALDRLQNSSFRISSALIGAARERDLARKRAEAQRP